MAAILGDERVAARDALVAEQAVTFPLSFDLKMCVTVRVPHALAHHLSSLQRGRDDPRRRSEAA